MTVIDCLECGKPHELDQFLQGICHKCATPDQLDRRKGEIRAGIRKRVERSGLPVPLMGEKWPTGTAADAAREWADGNRPGLVLTGPVGVGKTYLAGCAAHRMLQKRSLTWLSTAALMSRLRTSFTDEGRAKAVRAVQGIGPLVLDDLDKANPTEFGKEILFTAIDQRVVNRSPLLVTTNLPMGQLAERMGDPIASRLAGLDPIQMLGDDRRLAA